MKGTRPRGRWAEADAALAEALAASAKDRAENVMITDMVRNDMGRISRAGSVVVERLFEVERYATVWQMTSTVRAETDAEVPEILAALFPSASVTGAPKIQTSKIIHALEPEGRGVYCGALGWWAPDGSAEFSVGIRTLVADSARGVARYHVGSGITWDATAGAEYQECLDKAALLLAPVSGDFELLESLRWETGAYWLLEEHRARLRESAAYFGIALDLGAVEAALAKAAADAPERARVRLLVARDGTVRTEVYPLEVPERAWRVALAETPVSREELFLYHKTTRREIYAAARAARPDVDDVLLWNEAGELTESTVANVALEIDGEWLTPARACGLLAGTMRARWLAEGRLREAVLHRDDLARATRVLLLNSVRGEIPAVVVA
jgi:para-aminobenzoate synthetase/4-amino-4-deoxychorismate lyase